MKKVAVLVLIGTCLFSACQSATPIAAATSTFAPTRTAVPTETTTPKPTLEAINGGWSTFHSQEYGFQFLYPAVYDKGFYDPVDPPSFCNMQEKKEEGKFNVWVGYVWIAVSKANQSLEDIVDDYVREKSANWNIRSQTEGKIDSLPAVTIEYEHEMQSRQGYKTFLIHSDDLLTLDYYEANFGDCSPLDTGYSSYWVYEQVINTLRFDK